MNNIDHQHDSSSINFDVIKNFFLENLLDKWKSLARELDVNENEIDRISRENISMKEKFSLVSSSLVLTTTNKTKTHMLFTDFGSGG